VTRDPVATVEALKQHGGKDIWLWGSLRLMHSLMEAGAVDEVRMLISPASRGKGRGMFEGSHDLTLLEATGFHNGVALLRYQLGSPHHDSGSTRAATGAATSREATRE
jgi:dihydrofolate reductase